ncbi:16S rRNA (cytidine(1402)-2'-O)-methyltransferase [Rhodovastum atsumiense]|uniref:Ribosomal RNA small subunit methyltransferase I n=2 Tax=Rhodovastum atsumiense TaxID=504468 RepID=A0A5M6IZ81_9PROT|nr:16S rRNA (cytidine(1402)-2'-O)-methyltransferase [Rhodovastum atsumiense]
MQPMLEWRRGERMPDEPCDNPSDEPTVGTAAPAVGLPDGLVLVSTPIGNLADFSPRAVAVLRAADTVLCEDTRVTARLCTAHAVTAPLLALHEHNEDARIPQVLRMLREGRRVALVSDAGTPLVSDPGYRLVRAALAEGLPVGAVPGANAALLGLTLSGLPPHPFLFLGFLPPKQAARRAALARLRAAERAGLGATLLLYEAPHRLAETLADLAEQLGPRPAAVARELTKRFEEVRRGTLAELAAHYATEPARGEITVAIGPAPEEDAPAGEDLDARLRAVLATHSLKEAVAAVTAETGLARRVVYARALALGRETESG